MLLKVGQIKCLLCADRQLLGRTGREDTALSLLRTTLGFLWVIGTAAFQGPFFHKK
jgi:hypothetical protein